MLEESFILNLAVGRDEVRTFEVQALQRSHAS